MHPIGPSDGEAIEDTVQVGQFVRFAFHGIAGFVMLLPNDEHDKGQQHGIDSAERLEVIAGYFVICSEPLECRAMTHNPQGSHENAMLPVTDPTSRIEPKCCLSCMGESAASVCGPIHNDGPFEARSFWRGRECFRCSAFSFSRLVILTKDI